MEKNKSDTVQEELLVTPRKVHVVPLAEKADAEEIVQFEKSFRTKSPRRRKATLLRFFPIVNRKDMARVQLLLSNISDRPLHFKLKSEVNVNISAVPSGKGLVAPRNTARRILTWRFTNTDEILKLQPKMILLTHFGVEEKAETKVTTTRLLAKLFTSQECTMQNPPIEQLMLDAGKIEQNAQVAVAVGTDSDLMKPKEEHHKAKEKEILREEDLLKELRTKEESGAMMRTVEEATTESGKPIISKKDNSRTFVKWFTSQPPEIFILLIIFAIIMYLLGAHDVSRSGR